MRRDTDRIGWIRSVAGRFLTFCVLWWAASEGDVKSLPLAGAAIGFATLASLWVLPPIKGWRFSVPSAALFAAFFVGESLRGGLDVARRALAPSMPIDPGFEEWRSRRLDERVLPLLAGCVGLMPGTLTTDVRGETLRLHVLARELRWSRAVTGLERRTSAMRVGTIRRGSSPDGAQTRSGGSRRAR